MFPALANSHIEEDTIFGVHLGTLTGNFNKNFTYVEVRFKQITQMVKLCLPFPLFYVVNKEWLAKFKDKVFAVVSFEEGMPEKAFLIGFTYKENFDPETEKLELLSVNCALTFSDKEKKVTLKSQSFFADFDKINLIGDVPIPKGDEVKSHLDFIYERLDTLYTQLQSFPVVGNGAPLAMVTIVPDQLQTAAKKQELTKLNSTKVFIE
jgi:hypothetical protein